VVVERNLIYATLTKTPFYPTQFAASKYLNSLHLLSQQWGVVYLWANLQCWDKGRYLSLPSRYSAEEGWKDQVFESTDSHLAANNRWKVWV